MIIMASGEKTEPQIDKNKLKDAIKLLEEKLQSKTFIKAIGGRTTYEALKAVLEYAKMKLKEEGVPF